MQRVIASIQRVVAFLQRPVVNLHRGVALLQRGIVNMQRGVVCAHRLVVGVHHGKAFLLCPEQRELREKTCSQCVIPLDIQHKTTAQHPRKEIHQALGEKRKTITQIRRQLHLAFQPLPRPHRPLLSFRVHGERPTERWPASAAQRRGDRQRFEDQRVTLR